MKTRKHIMMLIIMLLFSVNMLAQTRVNIGPRVTGNFNLWNAKGLSGTWNGLGIGIGPTVDISFNNHIGVMVNLTAFDMKNFSNSTSVTGSTREESYSISYLTIDPMFKAEFSGFYMVGGPSFGVKLNSSGEITETVTTLPPKLTPLSPPTKSIRFDIALGTGYTFQLSQGLGLGTDFMAYIPITNTYDLPGVSNSIFSLKLGVALKFRI